MKKTRYFRYLPILSILSVLLLIFSSCKRTTPDVCDPDQYEPNDSPGSPYFIGSVQEDTRTINAKISAKDDVDFYKINARENSRLGFPDTPEYFQIRLQLIPPARKDYDLYLYSDSGVLLEASTSRGNVEEVITYLWTGKIGQNDDKEFIIEVRPYSGASSCSDYTLSVTMTYSSEP